MGKLLILFISAVMLISVAMAENKPFGNTSGGKQLSVVFVAMEGSNITSNCFSKGEIAQNLGIKEEEIQSRINSEFFEMISQAMNKSNIKLVVCPLDCSSSLSSKMKFQHAADEISSDITELKWEEYSKILKIASANYMLVFDQFNVRQEGYPYNNYSNIIKFSIYDQNKNKVYEGRHQFASLDKVDLKTLKKQLQRAAAKIPSKIR